MWRREAFLWSRFKISNKLSRDLRSTKTSSLHPESKAPLADFASCDQQEAYFVEAYTILYVNLSISLLNTRIHANMLRIKQDTVWMHRGREHHTWVTILTSKTNKRINKQKILGIGYKPYSTDTYTLPLPLKFLALLPNGNNTIAINANE